MTSETVNENSSTLLYSISDNWLSISVKATVSFTLRVQRERERERERESGGSFELAVQTGML